MWEKIVLFKHLKYSSKAIKGWHSPVISLSDIIDWENFNISSFSQKPKGFKVELSWAKMCLLIIEIAYKVLGIDVDNPQFSEAVDKPTGVNVQKNDIRDDVVEAKSDKEDEPELIREENVSKQPQILLPVLEKCAGNPEETKLVLKVSQIKKSEEKIDGIFWIQDILSTKIANHVISGHLKVHDIVFLVISRTIIF